MRLDNVVVHPTQAGGFRVTAFEERRAKGTYPHSKEEYTKEVLRVHEFVKKFKAYLYTEGGPEPIDVYDAEDSFEIPQIRKNRGMRGKKVSDYSNDTNYMPKFWEESVSVLFGPCKQYTAPLKAALKAFGVEHKREFSDKIIKKAFKNRKRIEFGEYYEDY